LFYATFFCKKVKSDKIRFIFNRKMVYRDKNFTCKPLIGNTYILPQQIDRIFCKVFVRTN
jgi:hypothetical protein